MATRYAVASGNWSDTATWNGGTLPTSADDVYANNFTVTIDQNVTVLSLRHGSTTGVTAGGAFIMTGPYTLNCSAGIGIAANVANGANVLTCNPATGVTQYVLGNLTASTQSQALNFTGAGTLNYTGTIYNAGNTNAQGTLLITGAGTVNMTGDIVHGNATNNAVRVNAAATVNIVGNLSGGSIAVNSPAMLNVTGNVTSTVAVTNVGIQFNAAVVTIVGTITAAAAPCLTGTGSGGSWTLTGPFISTGTGVLPFAVSNPIRLSPITNNEFRFLRSTSGTTSLYSSDVTSGAPAASNVRFGTVYANGILTGTMRVPSPAYVAQGVQTDNTIGTLAAPTAAELADAMWAKQTSELTTSGSIGERVKNNSTVDTMGAQLTALGT